MQSIWDKIMGFVPDHPGQSATQIAKAIKANTASTSSELRRMVRNGTLLRRLGGGPRGGFTYEMNPKYEPDTFDDLLEELGEVPKSRFDREGVV